jgi:hypothetical protein
MENKVQSLRLGKDYVCKTNLVIGWEECRWQCPLLESKQHRRLQMLLARYLKRAVKTMVLPSLPKISVPIFQVQIMLANVCTRDSMMKLLPLDHSSLRSIHICILTNPLPPTHTHLDSPNASPTTLLFKVENFIDYLLISFPLHPIKECP